MEVQALQLVEVQAQSKLQAAQQRQIAQFHQVRVQVRQNKA